MLPVRLSSSRDKRVVTSLGGAGVGEWHAAPGLSLFICRCRAPGHVYRSAEAGAAATARQRVVSI